MVFLFNRLWREYRYSRKSVPAWILIFQEIGFGMDTISQGISSGMDTISLGNWFRREYRFSSPNVNTDIPGNRFWHGYRFLGIQLQRERQYSRNLATSIFQVQKKPRFVSAFGSLFVGYMGLAFSSWMLNIWVRPLVLEHWIWISFGSWAFGYLGEFRSERIETL
ncbi:uncharacterized protein OCT59_018492 [Rhizophagus irregularis]|uniref:uncharacterized protein n=1 Tax=Rhizophagus irregularis TaxID=588596 RepID=UPI0033254293|nr:hypothetical protein OCT59_018492 [Rhizophagus irregularis]